ncbi:WD40-repeat-containing domain protein [Sporodiniella umbellata]|nr:WD40-repeat-containing domain protein [Sporodiniella umbellata]
MNSTARHYHFPTELLISIFAHLDGKSLSECSQVNRQWYSALSHFDDLIWANACRGDFQAKAKRRFWSLYFPEPGRVNKWIKTQPSSWQRMYRITRNWYQGNCVGYYPRMDTTPSERTTASVVIGDLQEQGMPTSFTLQHNGSVIRSNPNYQTAFQQSLMLQSPLTKHMHPIQWSSVQLPGWPDAAASHHVVCHYSLPHAPWLVTGALNGTVAVWNMETKALVRMWHAHRGRVLSVTMNDEVVLSGGTDNKIQVWDLETSGEISFARPAQRGMIDISLYLSERNDWYEGVGEIAIHRDLVACVADASGPILVFSLLTGSLVYELNVPREATDRPLWMSEDITGFKRLRMTPFFLLTKGSMPNKPDKRLAIVPSTHNVLLQRQQLVPTQAGYLVQDTPPDLSQMTPYQLHRYYQSIGSETEDTAQLPETNACIYVWDLQTGKIAYRLLPSLNNPAQHYTITDIQLSPDYAKVFASIQLRAQTHVEDHLFCWDFSSAHYQPTHIQQDFQVIELDSKDTIQQKIGKSWVCFQ